MKRTIVALILAFLPMAAAAEGTNADPQDRGFPADYPGTPISPPGGEGIGIYVEDGQEGPQENFGVQPIHDNGVFAVLRGDRLEYQGMEGEDLFLWDVQGWVGTDYDKLWLKSEGEKRTDGETTEAEAELLYSRNIVSFWDFQVGLRHDFEPRPSRTSAALGFQGLVPYWFETEATAYLSEDGDLSANIEAEYDILFSQRLILQPRFETNLALQEVEKYGVGQGINDVTLGVRLRYEIRRQFAPYVGFTWTRKIGETENLAEEEGEDVENSAFVAGVRFWY